MKDMREISIKEFRTSGIIRIKVNSTNSGYLPNTGFRALYKMMSRFAAFGRIKN